MRVLIWFISAAFLAFCVSPLSTGCMVGASYWQGIVFFFSTMVAFGITFGFPIAWAVWHGVKKLWVEPAETETDEE